jgi:transcriptional regulator with XRE-family HTH domain
MTRIYKPLVFSQAPYTFIAIKRETAMLEPMTVSYLTAPRERVGARLLLLRETWSGTHYGAQDEFADYVGISPQSWNNYERGRSRIELSKALQVVSTTGVSLDWIYLGLWGNVPEDIARRLRQRDREKHSNRRAS